MRFHLSRRYKEATQYQSKIDNYFDRYLRMPDMLYTNYELLPGFCTPDERPFFPTHLICKRYIIQCAPLTIEVTCVRSVHKVMGQLKVPHPACLIKLFFKNKIEQLGNRLLSFHQKYRNQDINFLTPSLSTFKMHARYGARKINFVASKL